MEAGTFHGWEALARLQAMALLSHSSSRAVIGYWETSSIALGDGKSDGDVDRQKQSSSSDPLDLIRALQLPPERLQEVEQEVLRARLDHAEAYFKAGADAILPESLYGLGRDLVIRRNWEEWKLPEAGWASMIADWRFVRCHPQALPGARDLTAQQLHDQQGRGAVLQLALVEAALQDVEEFLPEDLRSRLHAAVGQCVADSGEQSEGDLPTPFACEEHPELLLQLACWPRRSMAATLSQVAVDPLSRHRLNLLLTMRFGAQANDWPGWQHWLRTAADQQVQQSLLAVDQAKLVVCVWVATQPDDELLLALLECWPDLLPRVAADDFATRYALTLPDDEWRLLMGRPLDTGISLDIESADGGEPVHNQAPPSVGEAEQTAPVEAPSVPVSTQQVAHEIHESDTAATLSQAAHSSEKEPEADAADTRPDWVQHLKSFVDEHWVLLAGAVMILSGASLLAYYTWDKHWLVRYSLLPGLLAVLTVGLAGLGSWLQKRDTYFTGTASILRGLAIGLLPVHAMVPAVLAVDQDVTGRALSVPIAMALYFIGISLALRRWCGAVHPSFSGWLSLALGLGVFSVWVGPIAQVMEATPQWVARAIWMACLVTMASAAWAVHRFTKDLADDVSLRHEGLAWFIGGSVTAIILQALAWSHGQLKIVPDPAAYGPLVVAAGWLVLLVERRANRRRQQDGGQLRSESFIGFAALGLGLVMSLASPWWRLLAVLAVMLSWYDQARGRRDRLHWWMAAALMTGVGVAVATLPQMPVVWATGIVVLTALLQCVLAGRCRDTALATALREVGFASLVLVVMATAILQWHMGTAPWVSAIIIIGAALLGCWQACVAQRQSWAVVSACLLVVALPYLGCVDLLGKQWHGNHLVAGLTGLALFWAAIGRLPGAATLACSRSLVGFSLGVLALLVLSIRVVFEGGRPAEADVWHMTLDYTGALGMAGVLIAVAWWSRSLVPGALATIVLVILFPELKARFANTFDQLGWGTGLGGAVVGWLLALVLRPLSRARVLKELGPGDRFYGQQPFPLCRYDHSLLTWPMLAAAVFLLARVDTLTIGRQMVQHGFALSWKVHVALGLSALAWLVLASYDAPLPGIRSPLQRVWRRMTAVALAYAVVLFGFVSFDLVLGGHAFGNRLGASVCLLVVLAVILHFWPARPARILALRLQALVKRVAPFGGVVALLALWTGQMASGWWVMGAVCIGIALFDAARSRVAWRGTWACVLIWGFLFSAIVNDGGAAGSSTHWLGAIDGADVQALASWVFAFSVLAAGREFLYRMGRDHLPGIALPFAWSRRVALLLCLLATAFLTVLGEEHGGAGIWLMLAGGALLLGWEQRSWSCACVTVICLFFACAADELLVMANADERLAALVAPGSLAFLAALLALLPPLLARIQAAAPALLATAPVGANSMRRRDVLMAGVLVTAVSLVMWWIRKDDRDELIELPTALALLVAPAVFYMQAQTRFAGVVLFFVALASAAIAAVRVLLGDHLLGIGLSELHVLALGCAAAALLASGLRLLLPGVTGDVRINNLILAALTLLLIAGHYLAHPDLSTIAWPRFLVSGLIAMVAGRALRHLSLGRVGGSHLGDDAVLRGEQWRLIGLAGYHLSLALAITCVALLLPPLRQPELALVALALPAGYFYLRAERDPGLAYRSSAAIIASLLVLVTLFRSAFVFLLFPEHADQIARHEHYHHNSLMLMVLGILLLRLTGLGADRLIAYLGGLATMIGSYFLVTALPGLSPFSQPVAGAWVALLVAHVWTLVTGQVSPLRTGLLRLLNYGADDFVSLRRQWGYVVQAGAQVVIAMALFLAADEDFWQVPALVMVGASLWVHHAWIRRDARYVIVAVWQLFVGLHVGLLREGWDMPLAVWGVPAIWAAVLLMSGLLRRQQSLAWQWCRSALASVWVLLPGVLLTAVHVVYPDPHSTHALVLALLGLVLLALTPVKREFAWLGGSLLVVLAYILVVTSLRLGWEVASGLPVAMVAVVSTVLAMVAPYLQRVAAMAAGSQAAHVSLGMGLIHQVYTYRAHVVPAANAVTCLLLVLVLGKQLGDPVPITLPTAGLLVALATVTTWSWYTCARQYQRMYFVICAEVSAGLLLWAVREILHDHVAGYDLAYDVWGTLLLSLVLAGSKQLWGAGAAWSRLPLIWTAASMPLATFSLIFLHDLSTDLALIALGLQSVSFSYLGRGERGDGPFQALSVIGFVCMALLLIWSRLETQIAYAYVLPVGVGLLLLLQLFKARIPIPLRNAVRAMVLVAMLGSVGFQALQTRGVAWHQFLLLAVSLLVLIIGGLLRLRVYLVLGMGGSLIAVASLTVLGLRQLEDGLAMSVIGALILLIGAALVGGAILVKARRDEVIAYLERWRQRWWDCE